MTARYTGMDRTRGAALVDEAHVSQSVRDILMTPVGTRVMRREYGSLLSALLDQPQNPALRLQIMSACYMALLKWEPRITLTALNFETRFNGEMIVEITGQLTDTAGDISLTIPLS
ncbi:GPW/gp25 family protein [Siccibacter turicensis]|uniref:Baseplate assembly protein n=1 Tax=Siccibacter turicensis TaxID=357233 RepID=A0A2P8VFD7_9ENTR|nr:GPW/gp25 family protein [Siccibacter turicensis]PSN06246.1 baseplate assembly protein [Siccibacter turicensis]